MGKNLTVLIFLPLISLFTLIELPHFTGNNSSLNNSPGNHLRGMENQKCTDCHAGLVAKNNVHDPAKDPCEQCHHINIGEHALNSSKGLNLAEKMPELCYPCHFTTKKDIDTSRVVHPALQIKKQCSNCHSPHSSDEKKLLIADKKELCLTCHDKPEVMAGRKITNIRQLLKTSKVIHPALKGGCTVCHRPHASSENYLLISAYPAGQYAQGTRDNYALCWECHDSDLLELAKTTLSTNFRDGERNLHYVHVNGKKGRTCTICHDAHATKKEHLIVDKIPFGEWEMPINYVPADSGGYCFPGCHQAYKYTR